MRLSGSLAGLLTGPTVERPRWLRNVREFLEHAYRDDITLSDVSAAAAMHPIYVARVFRRAFGCTIAQFVRQKRLEYALRQLKGTTTSIAEIALESGFFDQSHFTTYVRTTTGLTPGEFRRSFGDGPPISRRLPNAALPPTIAGGPALARQCSSHSRHNQSQDFTDCPEQRDRTPLRRNRNIGRH